MPEVSSSAGSYPYLRSGFYGWDQGVGGQLAEWTDGQGSIAIPWHVTGPSEPADICLQFEISGGRPAGEAEPNLTIEVEGMPVYDGALSRDYTPHELRVLARQVRNTNLDATRGRFVKQYMGCNFGRR